jgi:hypothetical protein
VGETTLTYGPGKTAFKPRLEASVNANIDTGLEHDDIDRVITPQIGVKRSSSPSTSASKTFTTQ